MGRRNTSKTRDSGLCSVPFFLCPLRRMGTHFWRVFWALFGGLFVANPLPPTPFRSLMSVFFPPAIRGRKWLHQFYGRLAFCWKTPMPVRFLVLGGLLLLKGRWKCQFYFYGRGDFADIYSEPMQAGQVLPDFPPQK